MRWYVLIVVIGIILFIGILAEHNCNNPRDSEYNSKACIDQRNEAAARAAEQATYEKERTIRDHEATQRQLDALQRQKQLTDLRALEREARKNCPGFLDAPMGFKKCVEADELRQEIGTLEKQP